MEKQTIDIHYNLIEACKESDHSAFKQLYQLYAKAMYNVALRIIKDRDEASDILQDAFVKAYQKIAQFDYQSNFGAWLKKIVINQALDVIRRRKNFIINDEILYEPIDEDAYDWEQIDFTVDLVKKAINGLPTGFRLVANLYLFEGYEHAEISQILGISEGTSKSQLHRAKVKIKEYISNHEEA